MISAGILSFSFATIVCLYVGIGQFFGMFHPNYIPEAGETLIGFYATLWASTALPLPILVGTLGWIQQTVRYAMGK